jgi:hypothetical protein
MRRHSRRLSGLQSSGMWDLLNPVRMADATAQERLDALRSVRQTRQITPAEETEARRRRRLTARLHDVFHIRTRSRGGSPVDGEAAESSSAAPAGLRASVSESPTAISVERIPESEQESAMLSPVEEAGTSAGVDQGPVSPVSPISPIEPTEKPADGPAEESHSTPTSTPASGAPAPAEQLAASSPVVPVAPATETPPASSSSAAPTKQEPSSSIKDTPASSS